MEEKLQILKRLDELKEKIENDEFSREKLEEISNAMDYFIDSSQESQSSNEIDPTLLKYLFYGWYLSQYIA
jgi:hypothetical protein